MTNAPRAEKLRRYQAGRLPYIEFSTAQGKLHARVLGWQAEMILIEYPPKIIDKFTHGQREAVWINKFLATRIRKADSVWATLDDDFGWHDTQDQKISFRPDPWNIYMQEFPGQKSTHPDR